MIQYLPKDIDIWCHAPRRYLYFVNLCSSQLHLSVPVLFLSSLFISCLSFSPNLNSPTPTYVTMYPPTCQYWVVKCKEIKKNLNRIIEGYKFELMGPIINWLHWNIQFRFSDQAEIKWSCSLYLKGRYFEFFMIKVHSSILFHLNSVQQLP